MLNPSQPMLLAHTFQKAARCENVKLAREVSVVDQEATEDF